jgi:hypothetical protein
MCSLPHVLCAKSFNKFKTPYFLIDSYLIFSGSIVEMFYRKPEILRVGFRGYIQSPRVNSEILCLSIVV